MNEYTMCNIFFSCPVTGQFIYIYMNYTAFEPKEFSSVSKTLFLAVYL